MFSLSALTVLRAYAHKNIAKHAVCYKRTLPKSDPGLYHQKQMFDRDELQSVEEDDLEEIESDFMNAHIAHRQHEYELAARKEKEKLYIRKKYFKQKLPQFLTWGEIEQIRHLYNKDPEKWSIEKLSDGFPALPNVIAKVATSRWTKKTEARIQSHDRTVQENWKKFYEGAFQDLPPQLVEHLKKFSNRSEIKYPYTRPPEMSAVSSKNKYHGEFSEIITSYEKLKNKQQTTTNDDSLRIESKESHQVKPPKMETYLLNKSKRKSIPLSELESELTKAVASGREINEEEKRIVNSVNKNEEIQIIDLKQDEFNIDKYSKTAVSVELKKPKDYSHLIYPERIHIPKEKRKRGCTYKLNDCYYNDDGTFLYRVPGMT